MAVDIALLTYHVDLITESGAVYDLDHALLSLSWEEQEGQLASGQRSNWLTTKWNPDI